MERNQGGGPIDAGERSPVLGLVGVEKRYGQSRVLEPTDLAVRDGEFLTVVGPSGSGKTTMLRLIGGFVEPSGGDIRFEGRSILGTPIYRRPFNTVFQEYALFPHMTVAENVGYGLLMRRTPKALRLVRLEDFGARFPAQLSGGQRQRVALARAIVLEPRVVLLDEPLGALDASLRREMQLFLKEIQRTIRTTFLFVTHDQEEAIAMADRICVMAQGRVVQVGTPEDIYWRPLDAYVAHFFGDANLIPGRLGPPDGHARRIDTSMGYLLASDRPELPNGTAVHLMVRPEAVRLDGTADNRVTARIVEVAFAGAMFEVTLDAGGARLKAKLPSRAHGAGLAAGTELTVSFAAADVRLVTE